MWPFRKSKFFTSEEALIEFAPLIDIVGEAAYQDNLRYLAGSKTENGVAVSAKAFLYPEPENPHDPNAVAVKIANRLIGYLDHQTARRVVGRLSPGGFALQVTIVGGWQNRHSEGDFGVKIDALSRRTNQM